MTRPPHGKPPAPAPPEDPAVLAVTGLTRRYGSLTAVDAVDLRLPAGARHAVIGPNGAGKTTLLGLIAGTERPDDGTVVVGGTDVTRSGPARRSALGIARSFQQPHAVAELTALDNIVLALWRHHPQRRTAWWRPARHRQIVDTALARLDLVGLADAAHRPAGALSHGGRRLLDIAAALSGDPRLLLLDEPAAGLTDDDMGRLLRLLQGLPADVAVLVVEHHTEFVAHLTDTATVLASGQVLVSGATREVLNHPEVRRVYLGTGDDAGPHAEPAAPAAPAATRKDG